MALDLTSPPPETGKGKAPRPRRPANSKANYEPPADPPPTRKESVEGLFQLAAVPFAMFGQVANAATCQKYAEPAAVQVDRLADKHESIAKLCEYLGKVGPYAELAAVLMPMGLQFMVNMGKMPAAPFAKFGVVEPETLAAEMQAKMMREQREAMEEARHAHEALLREARLLEESQRQEQEPPAA